MGNILGRLKRLFESLGDGTLFGGATVDDLAHGRFFSSPEVRAKLPPAPLNVRRLAACMGLRIMFGRFKGRKPYNESERAAALAKLGLADPVSLDEIRARMIELAGNELGFSEAEVTFLGRGLGLVSGENRHVVQSAH